jgi:hypothetical protein
LTPHGSFQDKRQRPDSPVARSIRSKQKTTLAQGSLQRLLAKRKNYFFLVVSAAILEESALILEESALILEESALILEESADLVAAESAAAELEPALLQAAKAPIANTNKNFFICDCFLC